MKAPMLTTTAASKLRTRSPSPSGPAPPLTAGSPVVRRTASRTVPSSTSALPRALTKFGRWFRGTDQMMFIALHQASASPSPPHNAPDDPTTRRPDPAGPPLSRSGRLSWLPITGNHLSADDNTTCWAYGSPDSTGPSTVEACSSGNSDSKPK